MELMSIIIFYNALINRLLSTTDVNSIVYKANNYATTIRWLITQLSQDLTASVTNNTSNIQNEFTNSAWEPLVIEKQAVVVGQYTNLVAIPSGHAYISEIQYCAPIGGQIRMAISVTPPIAPAPDGLLADLTTSGYDTQGGYSFATSSSDLITNFACDNLAIGQGYEIPAGSYLYLSVYDPSTLMTNQYPSIAVHGKWRAL
jgi:hypothetical protein